MRPEETRELQVEHQASTLVVGEHSTHSFTLPVQQPFDWESLLAFLRLRATPGVETVADSAYTRTISDGRAVQTFSVTYDAKAAALQVAYSGKASARSLVETRARQMFKPDVNTVPIE